MRVEADGSSTLVLVGSGATVLEGDELLVSLRLSHGARLRVTSVAAQLAHPCPDGGWGAWTVEASVGDEAALWWHPEPLIVAADARFRSRVEVDADADATVVWTDEVVLGRSGEDHRRLALDSAWRVDVGGRPRWRDGLATDPGWDGPAVLGTARYVATRLWLPGASARPPDDRPGPERPGADRPGPEGPVGTGTPSGPRPDPDPADSGWLALAGGGWARRVLARDPASGRATLTR